MVHGAIRGGNQAPHLEQGGQQDRRGGMKREMYLGAERVPLQQCGWRALPAGLWQQTGLPIRGAGRLSYQGGTGKALQRQCGGTMEEGESTVPCNIMDAPWGQHHGASTMGPAPWRGTAAQAAQGGRHSSTGSTGRSAQQHRQHRGQAGRQGADAMLGEQICDARGVVPRGRLNVWVQQQDVPPSGQLGHLKPGHGAGRVLSGASRPEGCR